MKQIEVTTRSTCFTTYKVEVEDDFDITDLSAADALPLWEFPEIGTEVVDEEVIEVFNRQAFIDAQEANDEN